MKEYLNEARKLFNILASEEFEGLISADLLSEAKKLQRVIYFD